MNKNHIGSTFDNSLEEAGIFVEVLAIKRVIAFQVEQMMKEQNLSKTEMSWRTKTSRAALDRLLDPANPGSYSPDLGPYWSCLGQAPADFTCLIMT